MTEDRDLWVPISDDKPSDKDLSVLTDLLRVALVEKASTASTIGAAAKGSDAVTSIHTISIIEPCAIVGTVFTGPDTLAVVAILTPPPAPASPTSPEQSDFLSALAAFQEAAK